MAERFVIEDQQHAEQIGEFPSLREAWNTLQRLSTIPWDAQPNAAPCRDWRACGRDYEILEYDTDATPWVLVRCHAGLKVSAAGIAWGPDAPCPET